MGCSHSLSALDIINTCHFNLVVECCRPSLCMIHCVVVGSQYLSGVSYYIQPATTHSDTGSAGVLEKLRQTEKNQMGFSSDKESNEFWSCDFYDEMHAAIKKNIVIEMP